MLLRQGKVVEVVEDGLILAAFEGATYCNADHRMKACDRLRLYTDGILKAASAQGEFFGSDALSVLVQQTAELPLTAAVDWIVAAVQEWPASQEDDLNSSGLRL
jgi:serine phosphatase RsbU (regulator of sigma subunit)